MVWWNNLVSISIIIDENNYDNLSDFMEAILNFAWKEGLDTHLRTPSHFSFSAVYSKHFHIDSIF